MKSLSITLLLLLTLWSCGEKKSVQLAEVKTTEITEVLDVSAAYLFYDETNPEDVDLNRSNIISTTNWLINVDKRIALEYAIPEIIFMQNKKRNAEIHKNKDAKNYYTCNNTTIKNLGFIEFTDVVYHEEVLHFKNTQQVSIRFNSEDEIITTIHFKNNTTVKANKNTLQTVLKMIQAPTDTKLVLDFNKNLTFQEYITFKSLILGLDLNQLIIDNNEFIY